MSCNDKLVPHLQHAVVDNKRISLSRLGHISQSAKGLRPTASVTKAVNKSNLDITIE